MANLKVGSTGDDVKKLQETLIEKGYDVGGTKADGVFGKNTLAAVKKYQQDNGLAVDGIAGEKTLGSLYAPADNAADAPAADVPATESPAEEPNKSFTYDPHTPSDSVTEANTILQQHSETKPGAYQSQWSGMIQNYLDQIQNRQPFSYDVNSDALYQQYRDLYTQQGQMAMMDTMGQAAAMTGGYGNSYAQTAGQQMYNQYLGKLNEVVPELYQQAYNRYTQEGQDLYNLYGLAMDQENMAYSRYQDTLNNWQNEHNQLQNNYYAEREYDRGVYESDRGMAYNSYLDAYNQERDKVADSQWQATFDEGKRRYDQEWEESQKPSYSGGTVTKEETEPIYLDEQEEKRWQRYAEDAKSTAELDKIWGRMEARGISEIDIDAVLGPYYEALTPKKRQPGDTFVASTSTGTGGGGGGGTIYSQYK